MAAADPPELILAIDTATAACSAALWHAGQILARRYQRRGRGHGEALLPMVQAVIAEAALGYPDLDAIAVTIGPGTFTGLRIGLAAARGLALAADRPLVGVTTLEALAHGLPDEFRRGRPVISVLDARRGAVYAQAFDARLIPLGAPRAMAPEAARAIAPPPPIALAGDGARLVRGFFEDAGDDLAQDSGDGLPDAAVVAAIAARRRPMRPDLVRPLYLRAPDATPAAF